MANALGRISGQLLKDDLVRDGRPLNFENGLLYLNTTSSYVGINDDNPFRELFVSGTTTTTNLTVTDGIIGLSSLEISISGNTITSADDLNTLNLVATDYVLANDIQTDDISVSNNVISTTSTDTNLELTPNGTGTLEIFSDVNVQNSKTLYAQGDITLSGNLTIGNAPSDTVTLLSEINSDIVPSQDNQFSLGSDFTQGGNQWLGIYPELINGEAITATSIGSSGLNLAARPGNTWFVSTLGSDTNEGDHQNGAFATIEHALSQATAGDVVFIYPGTYTEITPLTIPSGVSVKGESLRSVTIVPDVTTQSNNVFLLNGETTVSDLTIKDFYTGYAFSFAPGFTVVSRSPYIQNISVITQGSVTSATDPRGFAQGDAGKGALVDGSVADASSNEASMLFHSVTMITPGVDAITMTNGVRVEWLNSFTYFANRGLYATNGTLGLASLGLRFGAEIRSIGSANVYGNYGAEADGASTLMYLVNHNFAYIGSGKDVTNDASLNIEANETVELNSGKIYYQSLDNKGNFRVGDAFSVSFETGNTSINGLAVNATGITSINFTDGAHETNVTATDVASGNIRFNENTISSYNGNINLSSNTNELLLNNDVEVTDSVTIDGNFEIDGTLTVGNAYIDVVTFGAPVEYSLRPVSDSFYTLGGTVNKSWATVYTDSAYIDNLQLTGTTIETVSANADLTFIADGTGKIAVPLNNVEITNDLTVTTADLHTSNITGTLIHIGNREQVGPVLRLTYELETYFKDTDYPYTALIIDATAGDGTAIVTLTSADFIGSLAEPGYNALLDLTIGGTFTGDLAYNVRTYTLTSNWTTSDSGATYQAAITYTGSIISYSSWLFYFTISIVVSSTYTDPIYTQTGTYDQTGNLDVSSDAQIDGITIINNTISTVIDDTDLELGAAGTGKVIVPTADVQVNNDVTVTGNTQTNSLESTSSTSADSYSNGEIEVATTVLTTTTLGTDLKLQAAGTGLINVAQDNVEFVQSLTVDGDTDLQNTQIILSDLTVVGTYNQIGSTIQTGNRDVSGTLDVTSTAFFDDIHIVDNRIFTTVTDSNLELQASGTGIVSLNDNVLLSQNVLIATLETNGVSNSGTVTSDIFTNNDISIQDNLIETTVGNNNLKFLANGTGGVKTETLKFTSGTINAETTNSNITLATTGSVLLNTTTALKVPVGTTLDRPTLTQADFRFDSTTSLYKGFNTAAVTFGGVYSANRLTSVLAHPTNNTLNFTTNSATAMTISSAGIALSMLAIDSDKMLLSGSTIAATGSLNDLVLSPDGTGEVVIDNWSIGTSEITNLSLTDPLIFQNTGSGYVAFTGTAGIVIPSGDTASQPLAPVIGDLRYNTELSVAEIFDGVSYVSIAGDQDDQVSEEQSQDISAIMNLIFG